MKTREEIVKQIRATYTDCSEYDLFNYVTTLLKFYDEDQEKFKAIRDNMAQLEELQTKVEQPAN